MAVILPTLHLVTDGSSLEDGYLSGDWVPDLVQELQTYPEAKGPIKVTSMGHGSWTSLDILNGAPNVLALKPTHIITEGGGINACVDFGSGPAISLPTHVANVNAFLGMWLAGIPGVDLTIQTMSSVSSYQTARTLLPTYYAAEMAAGAALGVRCLDNYNGTATVPGGWPKPLPGQMTNGAVPWATPVTPGFASLDGGVTFDATQLPPPLVLSLDSQTVSLKDSNWGSARSSVALIAPTHVEFVTNASVSGFARVGICNAASSNLTRFLGQDVNSLGLDASGQVIVNNGSLGSTGFVGLNIGMEVDPINKKVWFLQGVSRSAPFDFSSMATGAIYAAGSLSSFTPASIFGHFTDSGDGLHPLKTAVRTFLKPNIIALMRDRMAAFWP